MRTIKRNIPDVSTSVKNYNKYFNQLEFNGIIHSQDIYTVNQQSFANAKNVYVDSGSLMSRPTLQQDKSLPEWARLPEYRLIEIMPIGDISIYVSEYNGHIRVTVDGSEATTLTDINEYKLAIIDNYVICFNDLGAKVIDINNVSKGWFPLSDMVEIPVTKRVVGSVETINSGNELTKSYKEEYLWSNNSNPILPDGQTAEVEVNTISKKYKLTIPNTDFLTEYRIVKPLDKKLLTDGILSAVGDIVCIGYDDYVEISYDNGNTFDKVLYPVHGRFLNVCSISDDGKFYFFVAADKVYRYGFDDKQWIHFEFNLEGGIPDTTKGYYNCCHFLTGDIFIFVLIDQTVYKAYCFGPGLIGDTDISKFDSAKINEWKLDVPSNFQGALVSDFIVDSIKYKVKVTYDNKAKLCSAIIFLENNAGRVVLNYQYGEGTTSRYIGANTNINDLIDKAIGLNDSPIWNLSAQRGIAIEDISIIRDIASNVTEVQILFRGYYNEAWRNFQYTSTIDSAGSSTIAQLQIIELENVIGKGFLHKLQSGYISYNRIYDSNGKSVTGQMIVFDERGKGGPLPLEIQTDIYNNQIVVDNNTFYILNSPKVSNGVIWTNQFDDNDLATLTYLHLAQDDLYTEVPSLTHSDTELYLIFDNKLKITKNTYNDGKLMLNLPKINDQNFAENVNAMINISTTEIALFFKNKIVICSKVEDENFDYRYDYRNSRLSVGVRLGDSVINTLEGKYTVLPTQRGLALMSYQEFMATSDQTLTYISESIKDLWTDFYDEGAMIKIIQWRDYLLLTNGTNKILLLYLTDSQMAWWYWEVPLKINSLLTDQVKLQLISNTLYVFKDDERYWDFPRTDKQTRINWLIQSQPLHMKAPNYYKSIRQLVFQLVETTNEKTTIKAQVKLYRKKLTVRDPEIIAFKIEELRTFVKRFNYWKVNEVQWSLSDDEETVTPAQLKLNGVSVKYEYGEEVK